MTLDGLFDALADEHRRHALYHLTARNVPVDLGELTTEVASGVADVQPGDVSDVARERVHLALYHTHLPKLVDLNVVTHDRVNETFAIADDVEHLDEYLALARRVENQETAVAE